MKRFIGLACALLLTSTTLILAQDATPEATTADDVSVLFVQTADGGTLTAGDDGAFTLMLNDVSPTLWFTDRPVRKSGHVLTPGFVQLWTAGSDSFEVDPPNAVLEVGQTDYVMELSDPVYDEAANTLTYTATPLTDEEIDMTVGEPSTLTDMTFEAAAVFIDGFWDTVKDDAQAAAIIAGQLGPLVLLVP